MAKNESQLSPALAGGHTIDHHLGFSQIVSLAFYAVFFQPPAKAGGNSKVPKIEILSAKNAFHHFSSKKHISQNTDYQTIKHFKC